MKYKNEYLIFDRDGEVQEESQKDAELSPGSCLVDRKTGKIVAAQPLKTRYSFLEALNAIDLHGLVFQSDEAGPVRYLYGRGGNFCVSENPYEEGFLPAPLVTHQTLGWFKVVYVPGKTINPIYPFHVIDEEGELESTSVTQALAIRSAERCGGTVVDVRTGEVLRPATETYTDRLVKALLEWGACSAGIEFVKHLKPRDHEQLVGALSDEWLVWLLVRLEMLQQPDHIDSVGWLGHTTIEYARVLKDRASVEGQALIALEEVLDN